jgi:membrane protein required for beta-lactamase induction
MILIAILISLGIDKAFATWQGVRRFEWFLEFANSIRFQLKAIANGSLGVLLTVALPVFLIALVDYLLGRVHPVLAFPFGVAVLWYCLGPKNLDDQVQAYIDARESGDIEAAQRSAADILHQQIPSQNFQLSQAVTESILIEGNERIMAVLFWFGVLGPLGAALYRLSATLKNFTGKEHPASEFAQAAQRLHAILDWVPARLVAVGYAVSGSFVDAIGNWRGSGKSEKWEESSVQVLLASGMGALHLDAESLREAPPDNDVSAEITHIKAAQALVWRTLVAWVVIIALMTLAGRVG